MNTLQERFLHHRCVGKCNATCFLTNGVKLSGIITYVDSDALTLARDGITQLIFKHAIATVMPATAFSIYDVMGGAGDE